FLKLLRIAPGPLLFNTFPGPKPSLERFTPDARLFCGPSTPLTLTALWPLISPPGLLFPLPRGPPDRGLVLFAVTGPGRLKSGLFPACGIPWAPSLDPAGPARRELFGLG